MTGKTNKCSECGAPYWSDAPAHQNEKTVCYGCRAREYQDVYTKNKARRQKLKNEEAA